MARTKALLLAGVVALGAATAAQAADLPPPPQFDPPPPVVDTTGWYLRGDVGVGVASGPHIRSSFADSEDGTISGAGVASTVTGFEQQNLGDSAFVGLGVGYQINPWLRVDATGEYRTSQHLGAIEGYTIAAAPPNPAYSVGDVYNGNIQSSVFLANAYVDLGTWWCLTPFVGAGVGTSYNRVYGLNDFGAGSTFNGIGNGGLGAAREKDSFDLAYAAYAGVAYTITPNLKLELAYRYLNMGEAKSAAIDCTVTCARETQRYKLESQDIKLGMRWAFTDTAIAPTPAYYPPAPEAPIVRKY